MAIYDTRYGLTQPIVNYLNQGLPSISGIFSNVPTTTTPVVDDTEDTPTGLTPEQLALLYPQNVGGGGDGFSVYNPDPNMTRTSKNYNSRPAYEAAFGTNLGDPEFNRATGALNSSGVLGDYREKTPSGLATLLGKAIDFIPGIGTIKRGAEFLKDKIPVNRRAILENQLLGQGVMLDDIGRIVSNNYNTAEGIMSGYNAAQLTDKSFDKRTENISNILKDKYRFTQKEIDEAIAGTYTGTKGFNPTMGKTTNLIGNLNNLFNAKNLFNRNKIATDTITAYQEEQKEKVRQEKQYQERVAREADTASRARAANAAVYKEASDRGFTNDRGGFSTSAADRAGTSAGSGQGFSNKSGKGRTGY